MLDGKQFLITAVTILAMLAADPALARRDLVYVTSVGIVAYAAGTPAEKLVAQEASFDGMNLSLLSMAAGAAGIARANIVDEQDNKLALQKFEIYNVRDYGAKGDGITDDRQAIQDAIDSAAISGGTIYLPPGIYLLASESTDADKHQSLLTPKSNVNIIGAGEKSILKVAADTNARWAGTNAPNVFACKSMLSNCIFKEFVIDWNGANNLLTSTDTRRNNAGIMALWGGYNILCDNVTIKDTPGNQCIFFPNQSNVDSGQGYITVQNCKFENSGEGLAGNYNYDHSSVYLNGKHNKIINNKFVSPIKVRGTAFEIHGSYAEAYGNYIENYENSFYLATDYEGITDIVVHHNVFKNVCNGNVWSGSEYPIGKIEIHSNKFYFVPGKNASFANEAPKAICDELNIHDNHYISQFTANDFRCMQVNLTKRFIFERNVVEGFSSRALTFGGTDLGDGYMHHDLLINNNTFNNVVESARYSTSAVYVAGTKKIRYFEFINNKFYRDNILSVYALVVSANVDEGKVFDNVIHANYSLEMQITSAANKLKLRHVSN
jgi:hypothetical protein